LKILHASAVLVFIILLLPGSLWGEAGLTETQADNTEAEKETEDRITAFSPFIGLAGGALIGTAHIIFSMTGQVRNDTPLYIDSATAVPSIVIGSWVGMRMAEWGAGKMIENRDECFSLFSLKGTFYSAAAGAVTLTAGMFPLFAAANYTGSIQWNISRDYRLLRLAGISVTGGTLYGGLFGGLFGTLYSSAVYFLIN